LQSLMAAHQTKAKELVDILGISKGYVVDMLNYKKGMSKEVIRKLATHFKMKQEAFNQPYQLVAADNDKQPNPGVVTFERI
jgi:HTH-type transcriptional regulator / antitoxin HigA